jgi:hypothetical protein
MNSHESGNPTRLAAFRDSAWNLVMLLYLVSGLGLAPLVIGEILVAVGWVEAMNEQTMPSWMYGYIVLTMFTAAFALMVAWLPALFICILFWNRWRAVVPSLAVIVFAVSLFLLPHGALSSALLNVTAVTYVPVASGVGIEWLIRRKFGTDVADHNRTDA